MEKKFNLQLNKTRTPKVEPEAYFVLNDISKNLAVRESVTESESELLRTVYLELQESGGDQAITEMDKLLDFGILTKDQATAIVNHFFIERRLGTYQGKLIESYFFAQQLTAIEFTQIIERASIPEHTKKLIKNAYCALKEAPRQKPLL